MGANKFATMLHRNSNRITLILIYAVLEWTLILLLLLNSVFSYFIIKFAGYFGLKTPCSWCSRVDHLFDHGSKNNIHRDLLCEAHATEISNLCFCSKHHKLLEAQSMCQDCSSSHHFVLFQWTKGLEKFKGNSSFVCSCCGVTEFSTPYILIKPSWDDLEYTHKGNLIIDDDDHLSEKGDRNRENVSDEKVDVVLEGVTEYIEEKYKKKISKDEGVQANEDIQHLEFFIDCSCHRLVPIESIDSSKSQEKDENEGKGEEVKVVLDNKSKFAVVDSAEIEEDDERVGSTVRKASRVHAAPVEEDEIDLVFHDKECHSEKEVDEQFEHVQQESRYHQLQILAAKEREEEEEEDVEEENSDGDVSQIPNIETDGEVSIGTEIPDLDLADEVQCHQDHTSYIHEQPHVHGPKDDQETTVELKALSVDLSGHLKNSQCSDLNEFEEERVPDITNSTDRFQQLHQKFLLVEKKDSGAEGSLDGSVASDLESGDTFSRIEHLKSALKAEREALHLLYSELEEERSASAEAASQTMAMINRLQEEKAAMQMEALQYQRMMEEQSEYDQEALQLMNELMVKREKELDVYRKKVLEYEAKEKMRLLKRSNDSSIRSGFSSASFSNAEDSDELSIDLNQEAKDVESFYCHQDHTTPIDAIIILEESFADFEEERIAILEQLKVLEEKLICLEDEDAKHFEDVRLMDDSYQENGNHREDDDSHLHGEMNGHANGFPRYINIKHHPERRIIGAKGKRLLPLFDAMSDENGDATLNGHENGYHSKGVHDSYIRNFNLENKKFDVEEELDHLHERLQALEADEEFLKNCLSSLKKGDKGMDLLQEILQHLRDLRNIDFRARSMSDGPIV